MSDRETIDMIAEYMEKGFLENIEDMLKHDTGLFDALPVMIADERSRVRIGAVSIAESMRETHMAELVAQIPSIAAHIMDENPTLRGDAIYLLSAIGHPDALPYLMAHTEEHPHVREILTDTIEELKERA